MTTDSLLSNREWLTFSLGQLCRQDRQIIEPRSAEARSRKYISLEHVESHSGRILPTSDTEDIGVSTTFAFDSHHVLYGKLRPYLNKVALPDFAGRCTTELIPLLPNDTLIRREFLALILRGEEVVAAAMQDKTGSRMPRADMDKLFRVQMCIPSLSKQDTLLTRWREQFAQVERARAALEAQLEAARASPAAFLRAAFYSPIVNQSPYVRIDELAETCSGTTPSRGRKDFFDGDIPWVKTGELIDGVIEETEEHVTQAALEETSLRLLPKGTLLIAMYGQGQTRGRTGLLGCEATTNQACFGILPNPRFKSLYLQFWFQHSYLRLREKTEGRGGNQPNLNGDVLRGESVPVPDVREQEALSEQLTAEVSQARQLQDFLKRRLAAIGELPGALLREAFSGIT